MSMTSGMRAPVMSLKKNDVVQVIAGREKGKSGKILKVDQKNMRVVVERLALVKRHVKPTQQNPQGGIVEKETGIHYSNVLLMCPKCAKGVRFSTRAGTGSGAKDKKVRLCKKCNSELG